MATFDLVLRGGTVIDGTGAPARRVDVGVTGDRIAAVGDLSAVDAAGIELVLDVTGRAGRQGSSILMAIPTVRCSSMERWRAIPTRIDHVIVNGRLAVLGGSETGERPGRLFRRD